MLTCLACFLLLCISHFKFMSTLMSHTPNFNFTLTLTCLACLSHLHVAAFNLMSMRLSCILVLHLIIDLRPFITLPFTCLHLCHIVALHLSTSLFVSYFCLACLTCTLQPAPTPSLLVLHVCRTFFLHHLWTSCVLVFLTPLSCSLSCIATVSLTLLCFSILLQYWTSAVLAFHHRLLSLNHMSPNILLLPLILVFYLALAPLTCTFFVSLLYLYVFICLKLVCLMWSLMTTKISLSSMCLHL